MIVKSWYCFFFFKQKTAYEMRISDWSSDVCSSDLQGRPRGSPPPPRMDQSPRCDKSVEWNEFPVAVPGAGRRPFLPADLRGRDLHHIVPFGPAFQQKLGGTQLFGRREKTRPAGPYA